MGATLEKARGCLRGLQRAKKKTKREMTLHSKAAMCFCQVEKIAVTGKGEGNSDKRRQNRVPSSGS